MFKISKISRFKSGDLGGHGTGRDARSWELSPSDAGSCRGGPVRPEMLDRGTWDLPPSNAKSTITCASGMCVYAQRQSALRPEALSVHAHAVF